MAWIVFLLLGAAISGYVFGQGISNDDLQLEVLATGMMIQTNSLHTQNRYIKVKNNEGHEVVYELQPLPDKISNNEAIAGIYDRYGAFRIHVNFLACHIFYTIGTARPEEGDAEGCQEYAKYLTYYHTHFRTMDYYERMNFDTSLNTSTKYTLEEIVILTDSLHVQLKSLVEVIEGSAKNKYESLFQSINGLVKFDNPDHALPIILNSSLNTGDYEDAFTTEVLTRLYAVFKEPLLKVENFWNHFFASAVSVKRVEVQKPSEMVRNPSVENDVMRMHYKVMEESHFIATSRDLRYSDAIQYAQILYRGLEMRNRNIPKVLDPVPWKVVAVYNNLQINIQFQFEGPRPTPVATTAAPDTTAPGAGGAGPSSAGGAGSSSAAGAGPSSAAGSSIRDAMSP